MIYRILLWHNEIKDTFTRREFQKPVEIFREQSGNYKQGFSIGYKCVYEKAKFDVEAFNHIVNVFSQMENEMSYF